MEGKLSNPAPLGLLGFGMTTVLLNLHNTGLIELSTMILAMGICYGGIAQIIAGIMEFRKGNTFGTTAFTSYGLFWWSLVFILLFRTGGAVTTAPSAASIAAYLFMWGLFTFVMWIATFKLTRGLQVIFFTLFVLFWLLAIGEITGNALITKIAGWEGMFCGFSAVYVGLSEVLSEAYKK